MATRTSNGTGGGDWSVGATWAGGVAPVDNDTVVIAAGDTVTVDIDMSAYATGIAGVTITGHATAPGMLTFKQSAGTYWLTIKSGTLVQGSGSATYFGRLMMGGGTWGAAAVLDTSMRHVIELKTTTGGTSIYGRYLAIQLQSANPTNEYVEVYKTAYVCDQATGVNVADDILTFSSPPPAEGTSVMVRSSGILPGGLYGNYMYSVRTVSGNTCKLATRNRDEQIVDIADTGSGTLTMYDGHTDIGTKILNVVQDVTGDPLWTTTSEFNRVVLANSLYASTLDCQIDAIATITSTTITLTVANVDSVQGPLSRLYLTCRNVQVISRVTVAGTTSTPAIINLGSGNPTVNNPHYLGCAIIASASTTANRYGTGVYSGNNAVMAGVIGLCYRGTYIADGMTISGLVVGVSYGHQSGEDWTCTGTYAGCSNGIYSSSHRGTFSGECVMCLNGISSSDYVEVTGSFLCCYAAIITCVNCDVGGEFVSCYYAMDNNQSCMFRGTARGCGYVLNEDTGQANDAVFDGCTLCVWYGSPVLRNCIATNGYILMQESQAVCYGLQSDCVLPWQNYVASNSLYTGRNPRGSVLYDSKDANGNVLAGTIMAANQGGIVTSAAYAEGTHGDLQACGWVLPDPDWIHTSTFDTMTLPWNSITCPLWVDFPISGGDGLPLTIEACFKPSTTSDWDSLPRIQIIDKSLSWNSGGVWDEVLAETAHSGASTDWERVLVAYTPTGNQQLALRIVGTRTVRNGAFDWCWRQVWSPPRVASFIGVRAK